MKKFDDPELLYREYITNKLDAEVIAGKYNVGLNTVRRALYRHNIDKSMRNPTILTSEQIEFLRGAILGTGHLYIQKNGTNAEFRTESGLKERKYTEYKFDLLKSFINKQEPLVYTRPTGESSIKFATIAHPVFTKLYSELYLNDKKIINEDILDKMTPFSWAIFFSDSGIYYGNESNGGKTCKINISKFTTEEQNFIINYVNNNLGFSCHKSSSGYGNYTLSFYAEGRNKFIEFIFPFIPSCMKEKGEVILTTKHERRMTKYPSEFNKQQLDFIYGTLLGDGCIYQSDDRDYAHFQVTHSEKQADYLKFKFNTLKSFINYDDYIFSFKKSGFPTPNRSGSFYTTSHPLFTEIRQEFYDSDGIKHVTQEILDKINERALCYWFLDDGSYYYTKCHKSYSGNLSTQSFNYEEHLLMQKWFKEKWNIQCAIEKVKPSNLFRLRFGPLQIQKLVDIIRPYVPCESMFYKVNKKPEHIK